MKKYFEKHETLISILLIAVYLLTNSYCMDKFGLTDYRSFMVNLFLSLIILFFIVKNGLLGYYGLNKFPKLNKYLYFIPLLLIISVNLWTGININNSVSEIVFYMLSMIFVGFLEEIIFRGFLFKMMAKDNVKSAIIVSSLTFGIGHIINLFNGASLVPTLLQVCYATLAGFMLVTIFQKSGSLWPCIITHSLVNALSIFNVDNNVTLYLAPLFLIIVSAWYTIYLRKKIN